MDADITSAADSLALQRIQAQDYRDAVKAAAARAQVEDQRVAAALQQASADRAALAGWRASNLALTERTVASQERVEAGLATPSQERWMELYRMHLAVRLGPAIITSTTPNAVLLDMVNDATDMTVQSWPRVKAELDKLAPSANVN